MIDLAEALGQLAPVAAGAALAAVGVLVLGRANAAGSGGAGSETAATPPPSSGASALFNAGATLAGGALAGGAMAAAAAFDSGAGQGQAAGAAQAPRQAARIEVLPADPPPFPLDFLPENEPNNTRRDAQALPDDHAFSAVTGRDDADWYRRAPHKRSGKMVYALRIADDARCLRARMTLVTGAGDHVLHERLSPGALYSGAVPLPAGRVAYLRFEDDYGRDCRYDLIIAEG